MRKYVIKRSHYGYSVEYYAGDLITYTRVWTHNKDLASLFSNATNAHGMIADDMEDDYNYKVSGVIVVSYVGDSNV